MKGSARRGGESFIDFRFSLLETCLDKPCRPVVHGLLQIIGWLLSDAPGAVRIFDEAEQNAGHRRGPLLAWRFRGGHFGLRGNRARLLTVLPPK